MQRTSLSGMRDACLHIRMTPAAILRAPANLPKLSGLQATCYHFRNSSSTNRRIFPWRTASRRRRTHHEALDATEWIPFADAVCHVRMGSVIEWLSAGLTTAKCLRFVTVVTSLPRWRCELVISLPCSVESSNAAVVHHIQRPNSVYPVAVTLGSQFRRGMGALVNSSGLS